MIQKLFTSWFAKSHRLPQGVALLRVVVGGFLAYVGWQKIQNPHFAPALLSSLEGMMAQNPFPWYQTFVKALIIPNSLSLAPVVAWGEFLLGCFLVLGLLTPYVALATLGMNVNYFLATQHLGPAEQGINLLFIALAFAFYWSDAGQFYGLDQAIRHLSSKWGSKNTKVSHSPTSKNGLKPKKAAKLTSSKVEASKPTTSSKSKKWD